MKNIQVIDGATNSVFEIYAVPDELFSMVFPNGSDVAFEADLLKKLPQEERLKNLYNRRFKKKSVRGIHGTLHLHLSHCEPKYFPTRRESEVI